jgi:ketosteroid isomerase-like protein
MASANSPEAADRRFFAALTSADVETLRDVLSDDFVLIDAITGSEVSKFALVELVGRGALRFESVELVESTVRIFNEVAITRGRTKLSGAYEATSWSVKSRYTHVFVARDGVWRMVAAQGTRIAED